MIARLLSIFRPRLREVDGGSLLRAWRRAEAEPEAVDARSAGERVEANRLALEAKRARRDGLPESAKADIAAKVRRKHGLRAVGGGQ